MALVLNRNRVGVENTTTTVGVPDDPVARLMYYLNCMCTVLSLDQTDYNIMRLINYQTYFLLSDEDKVLLLLLCGKLNPIALTGQCLIHDENVSTTAGRDNEFYNINAETTTFAAVDSVIVGEKRVAVKKIMVYNTAWLNRNYLEPIKFFLEDDDDDDDDDNNYGQTAHQTTYQQHAITYNQRPAITYNQPTHQQQPPLINTYERPSHTYQRQTSSSSCVIL